MEIFKAHSVILRARSYYFRSAFSSNWAKKEGDFYIFKKPNVTPIVFKIILKHERNRNLGEFNKMGIAKNSTFNSDMKTWTINEYEILKETISKFIQHIRFFQMTPQEYYYKVRPLGKLLPKEVEEDLLSYFIVPNCKLATKVLPPRKIQYKFGSSILKGTHFNLISYWIDNGQEVLPNPLEDGQYEFNLLLRGSRDGFEPKDFHLKCNNKGATIVIIKLKNLDKMIGGYNPIKWNGSNRFLNSDKSFIFSFSNNLQSSKIILSRVKHDDSAVSDDNDRNQGFGRGDLYIFKQSCKLVNYSTEIHDSENFEIYDYEVFQIIKK
ncbi:BTB/POZ protein [Rhizophagus irregularis DAOM 181602=DAOM 197198]|nr:BTB/POZ protein [Rhizophagus irregularis DAOM 181602=DAOM 197198]